jgi:hypothetical protein
VFFFFQKKKQKAFVLLRRRLWAAQTSVKPTLEVCGHAPGNSEIIQLKHLSPFSRKTQRPFQTVPTAPTSAKPTLGVWGLAPKKKTIR